MSAQSLTRFKEVFPNKATVLAVVHAETAIQTVENVRIAVEEGMDGVFLINHHICSSQLITIFHHVRNRFENVWTGLNVLGQHPEDILWEVDELRRNGYPIDAIWTDNPRISGVNPGYSDEDRIDMIARLSGWEGLYFGGVAFKYRKQPENLRSAVMTSREHLDVITTSGPGTGESIGLDKIRNIRQFAENHPIAIASGVDFTNIHALSEYSDAFLVASSMCRDGDFLNFDPRKVRLMRKSVERINASKA